jgi:3-phenylpropionate/trans-cinnamate dioxygenase ferredoxin reductase component
VATRSDRVVIVGASLAGVNVARTLREEGFDGAVTLVGDEPHAPYERPPLSKGVLRGDEPPETARLEEPPFYRDAQIDLRLGVAAERIDTDERSVHLSTGEVVPFDRLVLATGGRPRRPSIPGIELDGVRTLRTVDDAMRIRADLRSASTAVVVGMGFIGSEVAASLRQVGMEVTAIEGAATPLAGPLGERVGRVVEAMHRDHGVRLVLGEGVARFEGDGRVERVVTSAGRVVAGDVVIVGLGMEPNVGPLVGTPVHVSNGVVVDAFGRTSVGGIHAAGDVANHWHPIARRHLRVEHWTNAVKQGAAVARDIVGRGMPYDPIHFFWSEQYGSELQYYGLHEPWDAVAVRGDLEQRDFLAVYTSEDRVVAGVGMGRSDELKDLKALIASRSVVPGSVLRDEDVGLATLIPPRSGIAA